MSVFSETCKNSILSVDKHSINKQLIKAINLNGREMTNKGLKLEIYNDGTIHKKYFIK